MVFKYSIGDNIKDKKRDLNIIDIKTTIAKRKDKSCKSGYCNATLKLYLYHCNVCGNEDWMEESNLYNNKRGCNVCGHNKVLIGYNDIQTVAPWMIKYFKYSNDTINLHPKTNKKYLMKCPCCGREKMFSPNKLFYRHSIGCNCSDNVSIGEKMMYNILKQLDINFIWQYNKTNCNWIKDSREYDFYFMYNNEEYIIETHGGQHYKEVGRGRTLKEEQYNDRYKYNLAINNGILSYNYIVIDCRISEFEFIKNNILNSKLNNIFDLNKINWDNCMIYSEKNIIKEICDYWHNHKEVKGEKITTGILKPIFNLNYTAIISALKKGTKLGWCNYDPKEELYKAHVLAGKNNGKKYSKPLVVHYNNSFIGYFRNSKECADILTQLLQIKFTDGSIRRVCTGERKTYNKFIFNYISKEEYECKINKKESDAELKARIKELENKINKVKDAVK